MIRTDLAGLPARDGEISQFDAAENGLCFGRLEFCDGARSYIGRLGMHADNEDYDQLLMDWRADAARPFYRSLVDFMTSGPVVVQVLEGPDAVALTREIMGATDPAKAAPGTIRADLARSIEQNVVHGSDAPETAEREIAYFFSTTELHPRA